MAYQGITPDGQWDHDGCKDFSKLLFSRRSQTENATLNATDAWDNA